MIANKKLILSRTQKSALKRARKVIDSLKKRYGEEMARWAFNRVIREDTEKRVLLKAKEEAEERLREIEEKLT